MQQVRKWLETPPSPDELDPNLIPPEHRATDPALHELDLTFAFISYTVSGL